MQAIVTRLALRLQQNGIASGGKSSNACRPAPYVNNHGGSNNTSITSSSPSIELAPNRSPQKILTCSIIKPRVPIANKARRIKQGRGIWPVSRSSPKHQRRPTIASPSTHSTRNSSSEPINNISGTMGDNATKINGRPQIESAVQLKGCFEW